jgi:hypothetical protein
VQNFADPSVWRPVAASRCYCVLGCHAWILRGTFFMKLYGYAVENRRFEFRCVIFFE